MAASTRLIERWCATAAAGTSCQPAASWALQETRILTLAAIRRAYQRCSGRCWLFPRGRRSQRRLAGAPFPLRCNSPPSRREAGGMASAGAGETSGLLTTRRAGCQSRRRIMSHASESTGEAGRGHWPGILRAPTPFARRIRMRWFARSRSSTRRQVTSAARSPKRTRSPAGNSGTLTLQPLRVILICRWVA